MYEYDRPKYAIIAVKPIKSISGLRQMYRHNYRTKEVPNADPEKFGLNRELIHLNSKDFVSAFNSIVRERSIKIRAKNNLAMHLVMSAPEVLEGEKLERWLCVNTEWLKKRFEGTEIISAVYHADETTQHIHAVFVPVYLNRLSARHYIPDYGELNTEYSNAMSCFGYERGREGTPGRFNSLNKYKAAIMEEEKKTLPEPEPGEDIHAYSARVQIIHRNARFIHLKEMDDIKTEMMRLEYAKNLAKNQYEEQIRNLLAENRQLKGTDDRNIEKNKEEQEKSDAGHSKEENKQISFKEIDNEIDNLNR